MLAERIDEWLVGFKKFLFTYRDGYFELPYLSNSPETIVEFLRSMPFAQHDAGEKVIRTDNIFTDGALYYRELEDGLWIIVSEIEFKRNVAINAVFDNGPTDYYFLSHVMYTGILKGASIHHFKESTVGWSLHKPGKKIKGYFNSGDKGVFINFAFNRPWFNRNIPVNSLADENSVKQYLSADTDYVTWNNVLPNSHAYVSQLLALMKQERQMPFNTLHLKMLCLDIISKFFMAIFALQQEKDQVLMHEEDSRIISRAENILIANLTISFPGIDAIAHQLFISPTKLKSLFKVVYDKSIYQYYQQKQMELAFDLLKKQHTPVKDIAATLGYTSASKFSSAFKKYHHMLPSEVEP